MKEIKVQIDYQSHSAGRGIGFYTENLIDALKNQPDIRLTKHNPQVIHYPYFDLFYPTLPVFKSKPTVVTIHDLTPLVLKDRYPKGIKGSINFFHQKLALKNVRAIITDSDNSKRDIIGFLGISPNKVFSIPLAIGNVFPHQISQTQLKLIKKKYNLPDNFVLCVAGGPNPNKNLPALAQATKRLNLPLVIVGKGVLQTIKMPVHPELKDLVTLQEFDHIIRPGFVPTTDIFAFYKLASIYCQPSLYEGFGLPVLEAMTAGCLVVCANTSSLPEIVSKSTPMFDPYHIEDIAKTLKSTYSLSKVQKDRIIKDNQFKAQTYSWDKTAKATLEVYKRVLEKSV